MKTLNDLKAQVIHIPTRSNDTDSEARLFVQVTFATLKYSLKSVRLFAYRYCESDERILSSDGDVFVFNSDAFQLANNSREIQLYSAFSYPQLNFTRYAMCHIEMSAKIWKTLVEIPEISNLSTADATYYLLNKYPGYGVGINVTVYYFNKNRRKIYI